MLYEKKISCTILFIIFSISCATIPKRSLTLKENITLRAEKLIGTPYRPGGSDPSGFDCSGFVYYVFSSEGIILPRSTEKLIKIGKQVPLRRASRADLIFFRFEKKILHVGIYEGKGVFIHASSKGVKRNILDKYWKKRMIKIKRVI
ncbi:MAG: C40 family peptidase [Candidatus Aminicenantia bacterium]